MKTNEVKMILQKASEAISAYVLDYDQPIGGRVVINSALFAEYSTSTILYAIGILDERSLRVIKAWRKNSPITETTLLQQRLAPGHPDWLDAEQTKAKREGRPIPEKETATMPTGAEIVDSVGGGKYRVKDIAEDIAGVPVSAVTKPTDSSLFPGYFISPEARMTFTTAHAMSLALPEKAVKVMMVGQSGYGKTTLPKLMAEVTGRRFLRMNCATVRDPEEWFGYREAREGSTVFIRSQFITEMERGDLVVVLDEFNRLEPWLHNTLFPLLDDDGATVVHDEQFRIGDNVVVVATINVGYRYTGTFELDEALYNRFDLILEVGAMPAKEEARVLVERTGVHSGKAEQIVKVANVLRSSDFVCSTRTTLLIARMVNAGMYMREAFEACIVRRLPQDGTGSNQRKHVVDVLNSHLEPFQPRTMPNDIFGGGVVEKLVSKVAPVTITLKVDPGKEFLGINAINVLRSIPCFGEEGESSMTLAQANRISKQLQEGEQVSIDLAYKPDNLKEILSSLNKCGLTGKATFSKVEATQ